MIGVYLYCYLTNKTEYFIITQKEKNKDKCNLNL
jgi:hypothetical protein